MAKTADVRAAVMSIDPNLPIFDVLAMGGVIEGLTWFYRVFGTLFMAFGGAAPLDWTKQLFEVDRKRLGCTCRMPRHLTPLDVRQLPIGGPRFYEPPIRIHDPIIRNLYLLIQSTLGEPVVACSGRAQHLDHQQQRLDFAPVQVGHEYIRLHQRVFTPRDIGRRVKGNSDRLCLEVTI